MENSTTVPFVREIFDLNYNEKRATEKNVIEKYAQK